MVPLLNPPRAPFSARIGQSPLRTFTTREVFFHRGTRRKNGFEFLFPALPGKLCEAFSKGKKVSVCLS